MEQPIYQEREPQPERNQIERFLTRMWYHPLLTEETIAHREKAESVLRETINREANLSDEHYCGMIVGSAVAVVGPRSDFDYAILGDGPWVTQLKNLRRLPSGELVHASCTHDAQGPLWVRDRIDEINDTPERESVNGVLVNSFLVPDDFAIGRLDLLHSLRRYVVKEIKTNSSFRTAFEANLKGLFDYRFKYWNDPDKDTKRTRRWDQRLDERAKFTRLNGLLESERLAQVRNKWRERFQAAHESFELPSLDTFCRAITQGNGVLHTVKDLRELAIKQISREGHGS